MPAPIFHALLVGVDGYFANLMSNRGSYASLGGCVNDVRLVEAMLRARIPDHLEITMLVGPADAAGQPAGDPASWPTAANLRAALAELARRAQPGDQVYVHYAGHGGRVVTAWPELKGDDGVDEALVPMDIGLSDEPGGPPYTRPERYVRDVELASFLDVLAGKVDGDRRVTVTLVFDSCHAGGATRGRGDVRRRAATGGMTSAADPYGTLDRHRLAGGGAPDERAGVRSGVAAAYQRPRGERGPRGDQVMRSAHPATTPWLPPSDSYVLLAACRDVEAALEASIDGRPRAGVLTAAFLEALATLGREQTWRMVHDRVLAQVRSRFARQTPQLIGAADRHVFGRELMPLRHTLVVTAVDPAARTVTLDGGLALGVTAGTEIGIYVPGSRDFSVTAHRVATATVREAAAASSIATLGVAADPARIEVGAPAVVQGLSLRRQVELFRRDDLPEVVAARQDAALAAVADALVAEARGFLERCVAGGTPHYQVAVTPDGHFELCDGRGAVLADLEPRWAIDDPDAAAGVVAQLRRIGRYHAVLEMAEPASTLRDQLEVELLVAPADWDPETPPRAVGGTPLERTGDVYTVASGTWLWLRLTNGKPDQPVNAALISLGRTWDIEMVVPVDARYETVTDPARTFAFWMFAEAPETIDVLKLFLAIGEVDFPALTTGPAATVPTATQPRRGVLRNGSGSALGRLVDELNAGERRTRAAAPARSADTPWTVHEFRMCTVRV